MQILNIGSINIDHVYTVDHFVRPGETLSGLTYHTFAGGKGFNQSIALARAGAAPFHAGRIGNDAKWLLERFHREGVDTTFVCVDKTPTGHAIIQVVPSGENAIILYGGANQCVTEMDIASALLTCSSGDYLLLQNETSSVGQAIRMGHEKKLQIVFNPAPMTSDIHQYPLEMVDIFILNETEACELTGKTDPKEIRIIMQKQYPGSSTVLTLGDRGAVYFDADTWLYEPALGVCAVDTTAAGDTFIGYFIAEMMQKKDPAKALSIGCQAAAICVTRQGASDSIPLREELEPV